MDVVVVGAGIAGLSAAYTISRAGHTVTILDPDPTQAAATVAAGRLAPVVEATFGESDLTRLCLEANSQWKPWADDLKPYADDHWYQRSGMIMAARDHDDAAAISRLVDYKTSLGLDIKPLTSRKLRRLEPALSPKIHSGALAADDDMVDNRLLLKALLSASRSLGATLCGERVVKADANTVHTAGNVFQADAVILAPGAWLSTIELSNDVPTVDCRPVKGQILRLATTGSSVFPRHPIDGLDVYLVPRSSGELVIGATVEDVGFDDSVTAGAVHELLRRGRELVPGIDEMSLVETSVGFRPATGDHAPVIGPLGPDGPFIVTGLYRNGILLAPVIGDEALSWISGKDMSPIVRPFRPKGRSLNDHY